MKVTIDKAVLEKFISLMSENYVPLEDDIDKYKSTMTCRKTDDKQTIECTSYTDSEAEKADCSKQIPKNQV